MPFMRAGFNGRHVDTGIRAWTRPLEGRRRFAAAALIRFMPSRDYAWHGRNFLAWGDFCVFATWPEVDLPDEHQYGLPICVLQTRREWTT